jgi:AcrR family transcriptional regulator
MSAEPRSARKRRQVLRAAKSQFFRQGFPATRMEQVARDADVSSATVYSYFESKEDLFKAVVVDTLASVVDRLDGEQPQGGPALSRLTALAAAYATFLSAPDVRSIFRLMAEEQDRFPALTSQVRAQICEMTDRPMARLIGELNADGALSITDLEMAIAQFRGMVEHTFLLTPLIDGGDGSGRRPIETVAREAGLTFLARYGVDRRGQ